MNNKGRTTEYQPEIYFSETELPIAESIWRGDGDELKRLIKQGGVNISKPGKEGYTYLLYATQILQYDMVKILWQEKRESDRGMDHDELQGGYYYYRILPVDGLDRSEKTIRGTV